MRKFVVVIAVGVLLGCFAVAQEADKTPNEKAAVLKEFTRTGTTDGVNYSFVHLNDKTVDMLFTAPGKYALRARANMGTLFYVQGLPEKDVQIDPKFTLEQDGQSTPGTSQNIKNFQGTAPKGERIDGLIQFDKKIDPAREFDLKNGNMTVKFKLSGVALKLLQKPEAPNPNQQ